MARATFSEHWHRIRGLRPRLRTGIVSRGTWFRGERWHVLGDPVSGRFHRLSEGAYAFVGLLDGARTVDDAWAAASDRPGMAGDRAPTQAEAIAILGQLWSAGLLFIEATPDVRGLLERASKGRRREVAAGVLSVLFPRVPLFDPDRLLERLTSAFGWVFSAWGACVWAILVGLGLVSVVGEWDRFGAQLDGVVAPRSAVWAMAAYILAKLVHELGHGVAAKAMARREGVPARVPTLGVMILLGMPSPYIDASAAWGLSSKWRRIMVGAAGMYVELALASIAAIVWSRVGPGALSEWAFATILVAGISTILFNINPLLRYDGYYILADLVESPNLFKRATDQLWHLVSRWVWGVRRSASPARDGTEAAMLTVYAVASGVYRVVLGWAITSFVWTRVPVVGTLIGIIAFVTLIVVPLGALMGRIAVSDELAAVRTRAVATTMAATLALAAFAGFVPVPHVVTLVGVVEPTERQEVHAIAPGFIETVRDSGGVVRAGDSILVRTSNPEQSAGRVGAETEAHRAELERTRALTTDINLARAWEARAEASRSRVQEAARKEAGLLVRPPIDGVWLSEKRSGAIGSYVTEGELLGRVESATPARVRVPVREPVAAAIVGAGENRSIRVRVRSATGRGGVSEGTLDRVVQVARDPHAPRSRDFEAIAGIGGSDVCVGERVITRIVLPRSPLLPRWIDAVRRTLASRELSAERSE